MKKQLGKYKIIFIMVCILLFMRVGVLLFFIDDIYFDSSALYHGTIAKEVMEGLDLPLLEYSLTNYGHGGVWSGIMTIPFFALFGKNLFALKMTSVAFSAGIMITLFLFAYKFFNRRVAIITGLLYLFSPYILVFLNLNNGGLHFENILFTVAALYVFYEIIFNGKDKPAYYLFLGLIAGFGTYWIYTFLATLATLLFLWFLRDKKMFLKKGFYIFLAGFLIGMLPWLIYNLQTEFKSIHDIILGSLLLHKNYFGLRTWLGTIKRFLKILCFSEILNITEKDNIFGNVYLMIYWLSFLSIVRVYKFSFTKIISSRESFLLVFPIVLFVTVALHGNTVNEIMANTFFLDWRYIISLFPCIFLTVAIFLDRLISKYRMLKAISIAMLSLFIIFEGIIYSRRVDFKNFGNGFNQLGYTYLYLSEAFHCKYPHDFYKILDNITKLSTPERYEVLTMPLGIYQEGEIHPVDFKKYLKLSARLAERYKPIFYKILIKGLYSTSDLPLKDLVGEVSILSKQVDDRYKPYFYQGLGALVVMRNQNDNPEYKNGASLIDGKYRAYYYRGLSEPVFCEDIVEYLQRSKSCLSWLDKQYQPFYLEGIGEALAKLGVSFVIERWPEGERISRDFYQNLEPDYKRYILKGIGESLSYFYTINTEKDIQQFINTFKEEDRESIFRTMNDNLRIEK